MKILTKYILKEIMGPLFFALFAFTSMFSGVTFLSILKHAERYHLSFWYVLQMLFARMPEYIVQAAPIAVLMATLLGLGKLTSHSETIAMRAGGLNYFRLVLPVIIIGTIVSVGGVLMNQYLVPLGLKAYYNVKSEASKAEKSVVLYNFSKDFYDAETGKIDKRIYAARFDSRTQELHQVTIEEFEDEKLIRVITTETMAWNGQGWFFRDGLIYQLGEENFYPITVNKGFVKYDLNITPKEIDEDTDDADRKSITELKEYIDKYFPKGSERQRLLVDYHLKFAVPFAGLVLAWLGAPLALRPQRRSNAAGFGLCIVFILLWYSFMGIGSYMARAGIIPPVVGAWLPNILLSCYGIYLSVNVKS